MSSMVDAGLATATSQRRRLKSHCTATFRSYITQSAKLVTHLWCRRLRNGHDTASTSQQQSSLQCPRSAHWRGPLPPALDTSAHSGIGCVTSSTIKAATAHGLDNLQQLIVTKLYIALEFQQVLQRLLQCPSLLNRILQHGLVAFLQSCTCKCKAAATRECSLSGHVRSTWAACASFDCTICRTASQPSTFTGTARISATQSGPAAGSTRRLLWPACIDSAFPRSCPRILIRFLVSYLPVYASPAHGQTMITGRLYASYVTTSTRHANLVLSHTHTNTHTHTHTET